MSITVAQFKSRTRYHLRDRDPSDYMISSPELERAGEANMRRLAAESHLGQDWTTLSITNATDTYAMPGSAQYAQVLAVRRGDGYMLHGPITREEMERWREGQTSANVAKGQPERFTLYETSAQVLTAQFHPWPDRSDTLDILCATLPTAFAGDSSAIPFDDLLGEALAYDTAAELIAMAPDEALMKRGLMREVAGVYSKKAAQLVSDSRVRRARQRAAANLLRVRR